MNKQLIKITFLLILSNCLLTPILYKESLSSTAVDYIQDIFITSDPYISFYGSVYFNNEFNFVCSTATEDKSNPGDITVAHYTIAEGNVEQKSIIVEGFTDDFYYFTVTSTNRLYFAYVKAVKNESTGEYEPKLFCYYYDSITKEKDNFIIGNINFSYFISGIKTQGNEVVFLTRDTKFHENITIITIMLLDKNEIKQTTTTTFVNYTYSYISGYYSDAKNLAYFIFHEGINNKFHLFTYNFTSRMLSLHSAFNNTIVLPASFRSGTLLFYEEADSLYFVCPKILVDNTFNVVLYQYNSTLFEFELLAEKNDCFGSRFSQRKGTIFFDVFMNNSIIYLLYKINIPHTKLYDIMLLKYSINTSLWERVEITNEPLGLSFCSFLYNATAQTSYLNSYFISYQYEGSDYRTFTRNDFFTAFGFLGEYPSNQITPYLLRVVPMTIYWTIISGIIIGTLIMVSGVTIGMKLLVKKMKGKRMKEG